MPQGFGQDVFELQRNRPHPCDRRRYVQTPFPCVLLTPSETCLVDAFSRRRQSAKAVFRRQNVRSVALPIDRFRGRRLCGRSCLSSGMALFQSVRACLPWLDVSIVEWGFEKISFLKTSPSRIVRRQNSLGFFTKVDSARIPQGLCCWLSCALHRFASCVDSSAILRDVLRTNSEVGDQRWLTISALSLHHSSPHPRSIPP